MKNEIGQACIFLAVFGLLFLASAPSSFHLRRTKSTTVRKTRTKKQTQENFEKITDQCEVPKLHEPIENKIDASFLASYPGSGTQLQGELVEAITGIVTTDDTFSNGHHNVIAIKTHYPCPAGREFPGAEDIFKALIFIRHPMDSLPAYYDIIYASEKGISGDPPPQAPIEEWISWRDVAFPRELETWRKHFTYWIDRYSSLNRLVIPYEQLISRKYGPNLVIQMANFLKEGNNAITTVNSEHLPCIWQNILKKVEHGDETKNSGKRLRRRLQEELSSQQQQLGDQQVPVIQQGSSMQMLGTNQITGQNSEQLSSQRTAPQGVGAMLQQVSTAQMLDTNQPNADPQVGQYMSSQGTAPQRERTMLQQVSTAQILDTNQLNTVNPDAVSGHPVERGLSGASFQAEAMLLTKKQTTSIGVEEQPQIEQDPVVQNDQNLQRPFTDHQRKEIVIVLTQLLELYRDDRILAPLLVGYIDQITKLHEEEERRRHFDLQ